MEVSPCHVLPPMVCRTPITPWRVHVMHHIELAVDDDEHDFGLKTKPKITIKYAINFQKIGLPYCVEKVVIYLSFLARRQVYLLDYSLH